jgi:hypothetical protein
MYIQEKNTTEDLAVWARPFAFHSYGELKKKKTKKKIKKKNVSISCQFALCLLLLVAALHFHKFWNSGNSLQVIKCYSQYGR